MLTTALGAWSCGPAPVTPTAAPGKPATPATARPAAVSSEAKPASPTPEKAAEPVVDEPAPGERRVAVRTDAQGRKWLGDVPYDVFFDDPLAVAAQGRPNGPAPPPLSAPAPASAAAGPQMHAGRPAAASSENAWARLIDMEVLDAEAKRLRQELTVHLQSIGKYNAHYQDVGVAGAALAAVAEIAAEHPGTVSWKKNAPMVRDLGMRIHAAASAIGDQAYQQTKKEYDRLVDVMDGNVPADLPPSELRRDFAEAAGRGGVMKRMDRSLQWLKKNGTTAQGLKKESARALEESTLLGALARVILVGKYDSNDDAKYRGHAEELSRAAAEVVAGVRADNAAGVGQGAAHVQKRCDACHADFRFQ